MSSSRAKGLKTEPGRCVGDGCYYSVQGGSYPGTDYLGCTDDHSPPSSSEVKNQWRDTSIVSYNFVVCPITNLTSLFSSGSARYEVPTEAVLKVQIFCDVTSCRLVYIYRRFGGSY